MLARAVLHPLCNASFKPKPVLSAYRSVLPRRQMPTVRFQLISDIHINHVDEHQVWTLSDFVHPQPNVDALLIAGDIGNPKDFSYRRFLKQCSEAFPTVFITMGNHEPYGHTFEQARVLVNQAVESIPRQNVHFLDRTSVSFKNVQILGCTLWSFIPPESEPMVKNYMNDYRAIFRTPDKLEKVDIAYLNEVHRSEVQWLRTELERTSNASPSPSPTLIMTHHLPSFQLIHPKYTYGDMKKMNCAFATDLEHLMCPHLKHWVCGHTHTARTIVVNGVQLTVNPHGYPNEKRTANKSLVIEVDTT